MMMSLAYLLLIWSFAMLNFLPIWSFAMLHFLPMESSEMPYFLPMGQMMKHQSPEQVMYWSHEQKKLWTTKQMVKPMLNHWSLDQIFNCWRTLFIEEMEAQMPVKENQMDSLEICMKKMEIWDDICRNRRAWIPLLSECLGLHRSLVQTIVYNRHMTGYPPNRVRDLLNKAIGLTAKAGGGREGSISGGQDREAIRDVDREFDPAFHIQKRGQPPVGFHVSQVNSGIEGGIESWNGSGGLDEETVQDIDWDCNLALHRQKTGRPQVGFHVSQANGGVQGRGESWDALEGKKGIGGREGSMRGGQEEKAVPEIKQDCHPTLHRNSRPEVGFGVMQANNGVEGRGESWSGGKRAKGDAGRYESIDGGRDGEVIPNIDMDCDPAVHGKRTYFSQGNGSVKRQGESSDGLKGESGNESTRGGRDQERGGSGGSECKDVEFEGSDFGESQEGSKFGSEGGNMKVEGSGSVESECQDAEGEGSDSGANQDRDGEGKGSLSGESQGQDRGDGSASEESQGQDRNAAGSGSGDDEDDRERERRDRGDIEQGRQESNQEEIDFSKIPATFMTIIAAITIAAVGFHNSGAISSLILDLLIAINVFGFLCCLTSMLHRHRNPMVERIFGTIGAAAGGLGLLLLVSVPFSGYYRWMILGLGSLAILVISLLAFLP